MSDENKDSNKQGQPKNEVKSTRNLNGTMRSGFNQYVEADIKNVKSIPQDQPTEGDYSKMNALLQKHTGMTAEKFVDYQRKLTPRELFNQLTFLADNKEAQPDEQKQGLPPNEPFVSITPGANRVSLPGKQIGVQNLGKEKNFELHLAFDPRELFTPKKEK